MRIIIGTALLAALTTLAGCEERKALQEKERMRIEEQKRAKEEQAEEARKAEEERRRHDAERERQIYEDVTRSSIEKSRDKLRFVNRSGPWTIRLCALSDELGGFLTSRGGNAAFEVWEKTAKNGWHPTNWAGSTEGYAIRGDKMKCAEARVPRGGRFYID